MTIPKTSEKASDEKMQWMISRWKQGGLDYLLYKTNQNFGTVQMATGAGKSGIMYEDIVHIIETIHNIKKCGRKKKYIINIATPILKLGQQFIADLFTVLVPVIEEYGTRIDCYVNSSDNGHNYNSNEAKYLGIQFKKLSKLKSFPANDVDIAIVSSCYKSLPKFINVIKTQNFVGESVDVVSYLDEAHLIDIHKSNEDGLVVNIDIKTLCKFSTKVYAFSATPDADVTRAINAYNNFGCSSTKCIIDISPSETISKNIILPPLIKYRRSNFEGISVNMLEDIMRDACRENPDINHKILVTLKNSEELISMRDELEKRGHKVFSTCSKYGFGMSLEDDPDNNDIIGFIKDIEHCSCAKSYN